MFHFLGVKVENTFSATNKFFKRSLTKCALEHKHNAHQHTCLHLLLLGQGDMVDHFEDPTMTTLGVD